MRQKEPIGDLAEPIAGKRQHSDGDARAMPLVFRVNEARVQGLPTTLRLTTVPPFPEVVRPAQRDGHQQFCSWQRAGSLPGLRRQWQS